MNEFKVLNDRKRRLSTRIAAVIFGVVIVVLGIAFASPIGILLGPFLVWSAFFNKYTLVNPEGIIVHYDAVLFKYKEAWLFDDISNLHRETVKDPKYIVLHFTRRALSKRLIFEKEDAQKIIDLAL
ncbi:MAG: hypothetical protein GX215_09225, partial [Clostridiales Family XIII bacterium]|nr:hypothetical protein [Clostridiales Family XIII bacterium]